MVDIFSESWLSYLIAGTTGTDERTTTMSTTPTFTIYIDEIDTGRLAVFVTSKSAPIDIAGPIATTSKPTSFDDDALDHVVYDFIVSNGFAFAPAYMRTVDRRTFALELVPA